MTSASAPSPHPNALTSIISATVSILADQIDTANCKMVVTIYTGRRPYLRAKGVSKKAPKANVAEPRA